LILDIDRLIEIARVNPRDTAACLVLADALVERGDPRGELLIIDHALSSSAREQSDQRRDLLRRYLTLLAAHGFAWLDGDDGVLPFAGELSVPLEYHIDYQGHFYSVRYYEATLEVVRDGGRDVLSTAGELLALVEQVARGGAHWWTHEETTVYLGAVSDAIRAGSFAGFRLPGGDEVVRHRRYRDGILPRYVVPSCLTAHTHELDCYAQDWRIAARDYSRWDRALTEYLTR
jgi:hypothetical protein